MANRRNLNRGTEAPNIFAQRAVPVESTPTFMTGNGYSSSNTGMNMTVSYLEDSDIRKSTVEMGGIEYQLFSVEIEKIAEIGLVIGLIEGQSWVFIDEILPNGMIDMHGVLKEGDFLIQAGQYNLAGLRVPIVLLLIERAYDEGRKTMSFVAARAIPNAGSQKSPSNNLGGAPIAVQNSSLTVPEKDPYLPQTKLRTASTRAQSFISYENNEAEEDDDDLEIADKNKKTKF